MVSDCHCIIENLSSLKSACESEQLLHFLSSPYINFHLYQQLNNLISEQFCRLRFTSTFLFYLFACLLLSFFCPKVLSCRSVPCRPSLLYPSYLNPPIITHLISSLCHPTSTLSYLISTLSSSPILSQTSHFLFYLNPFFFSHLISNLPFPILSQPFLLLPFYLKPPISYFISTLSSSPILSQPSHCHPQQRWSDG
jgi:hypothetical protein